MTSFGNGSIGNSVYVEGVAVTRQSGADSLEEMVFKTVSAALLDASCEIGDIDGVCLAASDEFDGRGISSMLLAGPAGGYLADETKVTEDGAMAAATAALRIESGASHRVLAVSWHKASESDPTAALGVVSDPIFSRPVGAHPLALEAIEVGRYLQQNGLHPEPFDSVAERLGRTSHNHEGRVSLPLSGRHIPPTTDGAAAVVLSGRPSGVRIGGLAWLMEAPNPANRPGQAGDLLKAVYEVATADRSERAWGGPVESTDRNVFRLAMAATGLGLAKPEEVAARLVAGDLEAINRSGGLWASNPMFAAGLERVVIATESVRSGSSAVLCHSSYGIAGQGQFVATIEAA